MNIGFITTHKIDPCNGGVERVTLLLARELHKRGHSIFFLSVGEGESGAFDPEIEQFYLSDLIASHKSVKNAVAHFLNKNSIDLSIFQDISIPIQNVLSVFDPEKRRVITLHNLPFSLLGKERFVKRKMSFSSLKLKGKLLKVLGVVAPEVFRKMYLKAIGKKYQYVISHSNQFIVLSDRYIPRILSNTPSITDPSKIIAINNPITFKRDQSAYSPDIKQNIVLMVCRLTEPQKNVKGFIDVWKLFSSAHSDWTALILGDGEDRERIQKYAKKKRVKNLRFEGLKRNVDEYYRKAKIFCMTSSYEGWPMTLMEAMSFGCVPVTFDSFEAVYDIIDNDKNGIVVPAFNNKKMVEALSRLADDRDLLDRMATVGTDSIADFTVEKIVDEWEDKVLKAF